MAEVMPALEDVKAFLEVLATGSFVGAARTLNVEAALISKRVARLERVLNVRLFARTTRHVSPTPEAHAYALRAAEGLQKLLAAAETVRHKGFALAGIIRVAAPSPFGRRYVARAVTLFRLKYPHVEFDLRLSDHIVNLVDQRFDVAIRIGHAGGELSIAHKLTQDRRILCASPAYLALHGSPQRPEDLFRHRFVSFVAAKGIQDTLQLRDRQGETRKARVTVGMRSDSGEVLREWALAGEGISLRSTWDVVEELRVGTLVRVLKDWEATPQTIYAVRPHRQSTPRVTQFVRFLAHHFSDPPWRTVDNLVS